MLIRRSSLPIRTKAGTRLVTSSGDEAFSIALLYLAEESKRELLLLLGILITIPSEYQHAARAELSAPTTKVLWTYEIVQKFPDFWC